MSKDSGAGEKTEKPTPKRLKEARKEGQVPKSQDVGAWVGIGAVAMVLPLTAGKVQDAFAERITDVVNTAGRPDAGIIAAMLGEALLGGLLLAAPACVVALVAGVGAAVAQSGLHLATKAAKPQFSRLNPLKGLKRLFGVQMLWETVKLLVKSAVLGFALWQTMKTLAPQLVGTGVLPLTTVLSVTGTGIEGLVRTAIIAGLVIAAADYVMSRRRIMKEIRMSHQEIKEENKQTEGDPLLKGAIKSRQFAMSRNRMMAEVATADVVLVNPTHVAVALRYEPDKGAPRVVAKGAGTVARRIRALATDNRVPMVENVPLARTLYGLCDLGQEIPLDLYTAVAQVLAFVMRARNRGNASGTHRLQVEGVQAETFTKAALRARRRANRRRPRAAASATGGPDR